MIYLNAILIYTKDEGQSHVKAVWYILKELRKHNLFANLKKCHFHKDKIQFLGYVILAQEIQIKDEKIKTMRNWPEPKSMKDIQIFLSFANFYQCFI